MAVRNKPGANPDPLGMLPSSLRPAATRARDEAARAAAEGLPELELGADGLDKTIDQAWSENEDDYLSASNPMIVCVERRKKELGAEAKNFSFKFFAPGVASVVGMEDYRKCLDANGDPYVVGEMWMGEIPTRIAEKRRLKAVRDSEEAVGESEGRFAEQVERLRSDAKGLGLQVVAAGDEISPNAAGDARLFGQRRAAGFTISKS